MKLFIVATLLLASTCSASYLGHAVSSQYQAQDHLGQYSYGYADPNSQKSESRSANGVTHGAYSYVDANGIHQSVKYVADPINGFQVSATNLPHGPAPVHHAHAAPVAYASPWAYAAHPVALHNGVPVETPEVQHAKAEHFAAHAKALSGQHHAAAHYGYAALGHNGAPIETPEVQHAKAAHFAAHAAARAGHHLHKRSAAWGYAAPWAYASPIIHNGVPVETPEVQHAKAEHFAAHAKVLSGQHIAAAHYGYAALGHNGAPVETPEVQHAKAAHFAAHAAARVGHPVAPVHYAHAPVIHNGVPVDTPEVQHAKAAHFAAVAEAKSKIHSAPVAVYAPHASGHYYGPQHIPVIHNGVPVETPEVQHAKAAHLAALHEASARAGHWDGHHDDGHYNNHWDDGSYHHW